MLLTVIVIVTTAFQPTPTTAPVMRGVALLPAIVPSPQTAAPTARLAQTQAAFAAGDYEAARSQFDALLATADATPDEQRLALYWRGRSELDLGDASTAITTLDQFLQQYPGDALARAAQFNLGRAYQAAGQFDAAIAAYRATLLPDDPANVYIHRQIGDAALAGQFYAEAVAAYQAGLTATEDDALKIRLRERLAGAELAAGNPAGAIAQYETILAALEDTFQRAKYLRLMGEAYIAANDSAAGYDRYLEAVNRYPAAEDSHLALIELVNANIPVDDFQRGLVNYYADAYRPAVDAFERYLAQSPAPANADVALWRMGQSYEGLKAYNDAIATFQTLMANYPNSAHWAEANFELGQALIGQGDYDQAKTVLREFASAYPASGLAPRALWRPARLEFDQHDLAEARTHFLEMAAAYPASDLAVDSLYWAGHAAYRLPDYEGALADWQKLIDTYPASDLVLFA
ncbi:MAG: tetratricopeptide repeat protein, partial [Caldilineaceae bacterium]|nr:tetratricopeptide repeat protein [Caldilineaceae bacterium]